MTTRFARRRSSGAVANAPHQPQVVLFRVQAAPGYNGRQISPSGGDVPLVDRPDLFEHLIFPGTPGLGREDVEVGARCYYGEAAAASGVCQVLVGRVGVLLVAFGGAVRHDSLCPGDRHSFSFDPGTEVVTIVDL